MNKTKRYTRSKEDLISDLHIVVNHPELTIGTKFVHIRKDVINEWTAGEKSIHHPYWSVEALSLRNRNTNSSGLIADIELDHVVPKVFFENMLLGASGLKLNIPREAISFLLHTFGKTAMVTKEQNRRIIDGAAPVNTNGILRYPHAPGLLSRMPASFYDDTHDFYFNLWARYMRTEMVVVHVPSDTYIDFNDFKFKQTELCPCHQEGFAFWEKNVEQIIKTM